MSYVPMLVPGVYVAQAGATTTTDVDDGGYDFKIGGHGFRLATDQQNPYQRVTEPTTVRRFDNSNEPGEQTLSPLPWIKSQASFHAGAGQLNLESGLSAFEYQQQRIEQIRFDTCQGVDVWTPGKVTRLPDTLLTALPKTANCVVTASAGGIDYAIVGANGGLYQAAWLSGADAAPTVSPIDLSGADFNGASNCNITSLATDGVRYFGVCQLTTAVSGIQTYVISGSVTSTAAPTPIYDVPGVGAAVARTNLCTNPGFESNLTSWAPRSSLGNPVTLARTTVRLHGGGASCLVTSTGTSSFKESAAYSLATTAGTTYTASAYVYVPTGTPAVLAFQDGGTNGTTSSVNDAWTRVSVTFTASGSTASICFGFTPTGSGQTFYIDDVLIETGSTVGSYFDGSTAADSSYTYGWTGAANNSTSKANPLSAGQSLGVVGWAKARLIACTGGKFYELNSSATSHTALPAAKYSHPSPGWLWTSIAESPGSILAAGTTGQQSSILEFKLDTSGTVPTLAGGASLATLPTGEYITSLGSVLGSFLAIGTNKGVRVGTFDTYTGNLTYGPLSVTSTAPVYGLTSRDRFVFAGWTNQQPDGKTGLVRIDLGLPVDSSGRLAYAPDLRPPSTAPTGVGTVSCVGVLPTSGRVFFTSTDGIHVEGNGPGSDVNASCWLRTSRIRYDTAEMKLFKTGRVTGSLDSSSITVVGITPFGGSENLGTFGFLTSSIPPEFGLTTGTQEWLQLQIELNGSTCVLNSYYVKAYPAPTRQHVITLTANCYVEEADRTGLAVVDPETPRQRYQNLRDLEEAGDEVRFVEFTNQGPTVERVLIDQMAFQATSRPSIDDDFGGLITLRLRIVE